ncbi:amino acid ABC transporter membrane protein 1, PAAT family [Rhizobiales bacterium GAS191]|jgi:polar amino acid transport system permease protein|nr:amino acid ABC transporter membrane protein 1, PAAT family [Rhizobiales bacterium GAS113]SEE01085.1 amino acid ABC transporter membrane protein 1, PAAT family [Rhizobiales bacterium GAS191]SEE48550.1 amino acid ABC transporter membrane protein 1, PAAT family [Rhizobiales bacterium GAS188]
MNWFSLLFGPNGWAPLLLEGAVVTILLAVTTVPFGFGAGLALAVFKLSSNRVVRTLCDAYTTFFRGIPDLLSLFIVYFGLQALIARLSHLLGLATEIELSAFVAGVIALSVVVAAYSSEVWVAALKSVPRGQHEAAQALGLDPKKTFVLVLMPQLFRIALPGLGNIWTILLKDTSLISTLAVMDLLRAASEASRNTTRPILFYSAAAAVYLVFSIASGMVQAGLERRANRGFA